MAVPSPPTQAARRRRAVLAAHTLAPGEQARAARHGGALLRQFPPGAAPLIARVEPGAQGTDTRFILANLAGGSRRTTCEDLYCRPGQANQLRLMPRRSTWRVALFDTRSSACRG